MEDVVLGIDTSNYTTSLGIIDTEGRLIANIKKPLPVKEGERGLRQSDALFAHTVALPRVMETASEYLEGKRIVAVGVSEKPRNVEKSYMPCFLAGVSAAESAARVANIPLYRFSHQCGHIMAALFSAGEVYRSKTEFAAFHISGGTTELLQVKPSSNGFRCNLIGETMDLNAGQVIDRVGVYLGLKFPAGAELEKLALSNEKKLPKYRVSLKGLSVNLSGIENLAIRFYEETKDKAFVAAYVLNCICDSIQAMSEAYENAYGKTHFVYAGGVMSNKLMRNSLSLKFDALFAEPEFSADNAAGVALLTRLQLIKEGTV